MPREEPHFMGYSFWLAARDLLYAPSHRLDSTYHSLCYTSRGGLPGTRNSSMDPPWRIDSLSYISIHWATSRSALLTVCVIVYVIKNLMCSMGPPWRSDSTTHGATSRSAMLTVCVIVYVIKNLMCSMGPPWRSDSTTHGATSRSAMLTVCVIVYVIKNLMCSMGPPWRSDSTTHGSTSRSAMLTVCVIVYVIKNRMCSMGPPWRSDSTTHGATSPLQCWQCVLLFTLLKTWCAPWVHHGGAIQQPMELHLALQCWQCVLLFTLLKTWCAPLPITKTVHVSEHTAHTRDAVYMRQLAMSSLLTDGSLASTTILPGSGIT